MGKARVALGSLAAYMSLPNMHCAQPSSPKLILTARLPKATPNIGVISCCNQKENDVKIS